MMSNGQVKIANRKFTNIDHDYSITFDKHAIIKDVTAPDAIKAAEAEVKAPTGFCDLGQISSGEKMFDVIAVIEQVGTVQHLGLKSGDTKAR